MEIRASVMLQIRSPWLSADVWISSHGNNVKAAPMEGITMVPVVGMRLSRPWPHTTHTVSINTNPLLEEKDQLCWLAALFVAHHQSRLGLSTCLLSHYLFDGSDLLERRVRQSPSDSHRVDISGQKVARVIGHMVKSWIWHLDPAHW